MISLHFRKICILQTIELLYRNFLILNRFLNYIFHCLQISKIKRKHISALIKKINKNQSKKDETKPEVLDLKIQILQH